MNRLQHIRKDWSYDEGDSVSVNQSSYFLDSNVGLELVVGNKKLYLSAAHFPTEILQRELKAIFRLLAKHGRRAGERIDKADLELFLCANGGGYKKKCCSHKRRDYSGHFPLLRKRTIDELRLAPSLQRRYQSPSKRCANTNSKSKISLVKPRHADFGALSYWGAHLALQK